MLWEVRSLLVARLGHEAGTAKMLQLQLDGMKLVGASPTMLSERNAIIAGSCRTRSRPGCCRCSRRLPPPRYGL